MSKNVMTKNVFQVLEFINRGGLDNSQWGLECGCSEMSLTSKFPVSRKNWGSILCPQSFLWVWVDFAKADRLNSLGLKPTWVMFVAPTAEDGENPQEAIFIWELRAED